MALEKTTGIAVIGQFLDFGKVVTKVISFPSMTEAGVIPSGIPKVYLDKSKELIFEPRIGEIWVTDYELYRSFLIDGFTEKDIITQLVYGGQTGQGRLPVPEVELFTTQFDYPDFPISYTE